MVMYDGCSYVVNEMYGGCGYVVDAAEVPVDTL